jgi:hypothetical protein
LFDKIILELHTIRDLANLILTARFAYHAFNVQRQTILFRVLQNELGPALPDTRFLFLFPYSKPGDDDWEGYWVWILVMGGMYRDMLPQNELLPGIRKNAQVDPGLPRIEVLTALCRTLHLINFLTDTYIATQLTSFNLAGGGDTPATAPVYRPERQRIMRAFYRRQILSNAWASTRRPGSYWDEMDSYVFSNGSTETGLRLGFLTAFAPWDLQQIDHVDYFITRLCRALVHRAAGAAEKGRGREISPRWFGDLHAHLDQLVRYLRTHERVAEAALWDLRAGRAPPEDDRVWHEFVARYDLVPLSCVWQEHLLEVLLDPAFDRAEQQGLLLSDVVGDDHDQVSFGWSDALGGRYVRWYGAGLRDIPWLPPWDSSEKEEDHISAIDLWRFAGFALWDRERVEVLKRLSKYEALQTGFVLDRSEVHTS